MEGDLHESCYQGWLEKVRRLLAAGADPNAPAGSGGRVWIPPNPRPLVCVAIAWGMTNAHVEIARHLVAHGAGVDKEVFEAHAIEAVGSAADRAFVSVLRVALTRPDPRTHRILCAPVADPSSVFAASPGTPETPFARLFAAGALDAWPTFSGGFSSPRSPFAVSVLTPAPRIAAVAMALREVTSQDEVAEEDVPSFERV